MLKPIACTVALALIATAQPATAHNAQRWTLNRETAHNVYIMDHDLTLDDCARAANRLVRIYPRDEITCSPQHGPSVAPRGKGRGK